MKVSNCCGEIGGWLVIGKSYTHEQAELCPKCGEHCEYVEEEEKQKTALMQLIDWIDKKLTMSDGCLSADVAYIKEHATELLQKERNQIEDSYEAGAVTIIDNRDFGNLIISKQDYYNKNYKQ